MLLRFVSLTIVVASGLVPGANAQQFDGDDLFREFLENEARALSLDDTKDLSIRELVDVIMKVKLTARLGLSKEEANVLFGEMGRHLDQIHRLKWERGALNFYLRTGLTASANDDDLLDKLGSAMKVEVKIAELIQDMVNQASHCLNAKQQVDLFLFTFDFENDIKKLVQQAVDLAIQRHGPVSGEFNPHSDGKKVDATKNHEDGVHQIEPSKAKP